MAWKIFSFVITWLPSFAMFSLIDWARRKPIRWDYNLGVALLISTTVQLLIFSNDARVLVLAFFAGSMGGWRAQLRQLRTGKRKHVNPWMLLLSGFAAVLVIYLLIRRFPLYE